MIAQMNGSDLLIFAVQMDGDIVEQFSEHKQGASCPIAFCVEREKSVQRGHSSSSGESKMAPILSS